MFVFCHATSYSLVKPIDVLMFVIEEGNIFDISFLCFNILISSPPNHLFTFFLLGVALVITFNSKICLVDVVTLCEWVLFLVGDNLLSVINHVRGSTLAIILLLTIVTMRSKFVPFLFVLLNSFFIFIFIFSSFSF